jgi:hypothetical protein
LKVAETCVLIAHKGGLGNLAFKHRKNLRVGDVAHLIVLLDDFTVLVAYTIFSSLHQGVAGLVFGADVAVDARPALITVAGITISDGSVSTSR